VGLEEEAAVLVGALLAEKDSSLNHPHPKVIEDIVSRLGDSQYRRLTIRGSIMSLAELVTVSLTAIDTALATDAAMGTG
jgi:hypothetical protein